MPSELMLGKTSSDVNWQLVHEDGSRMDIDEFPVNQVVKTGQILKNFVMGIPRDPNGEFTWVLVNAYPEFGSNGSLSRIVVMFTDISDIKSAEEQTRLHLEHLTALVEIDRAINFSFDLKLSLATLLTHAIVQLGVDCRRHTAV